MSHLSFVEFSWSDIQQAASIAYLNPDLLFFPLDFVRVGPYKFRKAITSDPCSCQHHIFNPRAMRTVLTRACLTN